MHDLIAARHDMLQFEIIDFYIMKIKLYDKEIDFVINILFI